ncbi:MAG TPA: phosphate starvation-inducible protein PhoH [Bacteroidetes bacterium]|nr:MAG: PhoH family protein [Rhodothermaceae bacterium TMED105]HBD42320.1 phosphate starvation-inducible protein PhoH [Bacteroidota bacterium]|tara:strand:- start:2978 stop:4063 length:1086 start_codon:yes stop_codon:yes gene_type:complete
MTEPSSSTESTVQPVVFSLEHSTPVELFGPADRHLKQLEASFPDCVITARGSTLKLSGEMRETAALREIFSELESMIQRGQEIDAHDIDTLVTLWSPSPQRITGGSASQGSSKQATNKRSKGGEKDPSAILHTHRGEPVLARTKGQQAIVDQSEDHDIVFAIGPAGTGKTYTSVALAVAALKSKRVQKIILARPAVEAGETLGFLPGAIKEKIDPYLRPLYDALEEMIDPERLDFFLSKNIIEIAPLAYMRGRTLNNAFVILDEAQNATQAQLKMLLTRIGFNSRAIITGDITQTDLPSSTQSGLKTVQSILTNIRGISFVHLDRSDVVRHRLVKDIIQAYESFEDAQDQRPKKRSSSKGA